MFTLGFIKVAWSEKTKESAKRRAQAAGLLAGDAARARRETPFQYVLNPFVPGPIDEIYHRLDRRGQASMAEHPKRSSLIPFYAPIRSGKAGKKEIEKATKGED